VPRAITRLVAVVELDPSSHGDTPHATGGVKEHVWDESYESTSSRIVDSVDVITLAFKMTSSGHRTNCVLQSTSQIRALYDARLV
jgi:hypothetical protein